MGDPGAEGEGGVICTDAAGYNIALGYFAGSDLTTGNSNIYIGNEGTNESSTIRIGDSQTRTFISGIRGVSTGVANAVPVVIDSSGQLGTRSSSARFKEEIDDLGELSHRLLALRPVKFRYKAEVQAGERPIEYGLIAEEVAEVFPELVVYDEQGRPETVRYHILSTLLLNELQALHRQRAAEREALEARLEALEAVVDPRGTAAAGESP